MFNLFLLIIILGAGFAIAYGLCGTLATRAVYKALYASDAFNIIKKEAD